MCEDLKRMEEIIKIGFSPKKKKKKEIFEEKKNHIFFKGTHFLKKCRRFFF